MDILLKKLPDDVYLKLKNEASRKEISTLALIRNILSTHCQDSTLVEQEKQYNKMSEQICELLAANNDAINKSTNILRERI